MLDIASTASRIPASQKHQARVAKHNTSLKLSPLFLHGCQRVLEEEDVCGMCLVRCLKHYNELWATWTRGCQQNHCIRKQHLLCTENPHTAVPCCVTAVRKKTFGMRYKPQIWPSVAIVKKAKELLKKEDSQVTPALPKKFPSTLAKRRDLFFSGCGSQCNYLGNCYFQSGLLLDTAQYGNVIRTARANCFRMF